MVQGTGSDVGKSLLAAALGRALVQRGLDVAPFKPQNMSNNAAVTVEGGEIGRAQALQARACKQPLRNDFNPVLLKPQSEVGSQVVVHGQVHGNATAREYQRLKPSLLPAVMASFRRLQEAHDFVIVEGAGSAAEVNLRANDIANMGFAEAADVPVLLVADIERGGVIASLCGTVDLLAPSERSRLCGFAVNKFRGDPRLFDEGVAFIEKRTGIRCFGVVPYFHGAGALPEEDAMAFTRRPASAMGATGATSDERPLRIAVPVLSRIANFDDFDPFSADPDVQFDFVPRGTPIADADLIILPGSKATRADLAVLMDEGWDIDIKAHVRRGGWVLGICAGYQMLGQVVRDLAGIEGPPGESSGLRLLAVDTVMAPTKHLVERTGIDKATGEAVHGYEMHVGHTDGPAVASPMLMLDGKPHGVRDGRILGCYLHGLFAKDAFRRAFLRDVRASRGLPVGTQGSESYEASVERALDAAADHIEAHLDVAAILAAGGYATSASNPTPAASTPAAAT